jgi:ATP-dependent DNA helicase RecG
LSVLSTSILQNRIEYIKGIGPHRAAILQKELQLVTFEDLLSFFPNRYIDKTRYYKISEIQDTNAEVQIIGTISHIKYVEGTGKFKLKKRLVAVFEDETGSIELVWFQGQKWIKEHLKLHTPYVIFGKCNRFGFTFSMAHPDMELLSDHEKGVRLFMQPVYPSTEKLQKNNISNKLIHKLIHNVLTEIYPLIEENLPAYLLDELKLMPKKNAVASLHFPKNNEVLARAQFRLKFEELFFIQLQLLIKNLIHKQKIKGFVFDIVGEAFNTFYSNHLPFELTQAQKRVLKEIRNDMGSKAQMNRLLQGDVGSGKTIVAFMCMLLAIDNNYQCCLMAPTEILAQQHYQSISEFAQKLNITCALLTGSTTATNRKTIFEELENGTLQIVVGTHALLEDNVKFKQLGLAVIDEQHRFGVAQRSKLWKKNPIPPHILVMTATPIPRTLAMSLYGDLDISVIDELPPGRKPIKTLHYFDNQRMAVFNLIRKEIAKGRQVYVVYPLIQESETLEYKNLMEGFEIIADAFPLPEYAISILHGQMKPADKEYEMQRFVKGETQIMVATTVIEVGVNIPNASVMLIESAERFGLSQLHQLRGRVGRGAEQSYCVLLSGHKLSNDSKIRIETMVKTNDGFEIAEVDLKLRGPGDLMGTQQSGILHLKIADLVKDRDILQQARYHAIQLLKKDPLLQKPEHAKTKSTYEALNQDRTIWNYIS